MSQNGLELVVAWRFDVYWLSLEALKWAFLGTSVTYLTEILNISEYIPQIGTPGTFKSPPHLSPPPPQSCHRYLISFANVFIVLVS